MKVKSESEVAQSYPNLSDPMAQGGESRAQGSLGGSPERGLVAGGALLPWGTPFTYSSRRGQHSVPDRSSFLEMLPPAPGWVRHWTERRGCPSSSILAFLSFDLHSRRYNINLRKKGIALQSCDPIDGSPPGSPVPGILQARTLECVAISFSNA